MIPAFLSRFKTVTDDIQTLRENFAALEAERSKIGSEMRHIRELPPTRDEVKQLLASTVEMFNDSWAKKLREQLELVIKNPNLSQHSEEFVERFRPSAGDFGWLTDNGFHSLLIGAMLSVGIDHFVSTMEWPDAEAISNQERTRLLGELEKKLAPVTEKASAIHEALTKSGIDVHAPNQ